MNKNNQSGGLRVWGRRRLSCWSARGLSLAILRLLFPGACWDSEPALSLGDGPDIDRLPVMSPTVHLCLSNTTWLQAAYLPSSSSSSSSPPPSVCCSLKSETKGCPKSSYWRGAGQPLQPGPAQGRPQRPALRLGNYQPIDSSNRDHFLTSCTITKTLIISPAHLHGFRANVRVSIDLLMEMPELKTRGGEASVTVETCILGFKIRWDATEVSAPKISASG